MPPWSSPPASGSQLTVNVTPQKQAWNPGEQFTVKITFTNTSVEKLRNGNGKASPLALIATHKRNGQSLDMTTLDKRSPFQIGLPLTSAQVEQLDRQPRQRLGIVAVDDPPVKASGGHAVTDSTRDLSCLGTPSNRPTFARGRSRSADLKGDAWNEEPVLASNRDTNLPATPPPNIPSAHPHARKISLSLSVRSPESELPNSVSSPWSSPSSSSNLPRIDETGSSYSSGSVSNYQRSNPRTVSGDSLTIMWAHARLRGRFTPSPAYIPPDPLLPLRFAMLNQPLGSGGFSDITSSPNSNPSRFSIPIGSGTSSTGHSKTPSLTGSLFGMAKGLVTGVQAGSLEEERRRVWSDKDLPVLETGRTLIDVGKRLGSQESVSYNYSFTLPDSLPPTFKGQAIRFAFSLSLSISVGPSNQSGAGSKAQDFEVPFVVMPGSNSFQPFSANHISTRNHIYDILNPHISSTSQGTISSPNAISPPPKEPPQSDSQGPDEVNSLESLLSWSDTFLKGSTAEDPIRPVSPIIPNGNPVITSPIVSEPPDIVSSPLVDKLTLEPRSDVPAKMTSKTVFEISRQGQQLGIVRLRRAHAVVGQAVIGSITINQVDWPLHVCKFSAALIAEERIPYHLLPPSASSSTPEQPILRKIISEQHSSLTFDTLRLNFSLDIMSHNTPTFSVDSLPEEEKHDQGIKHNAKNHKWGGGLRYFVQLCFGVTRKHEHPALVPEEVLDPDNLYHSAYDRGMKDDFQLEQGMDGGPSKLELVTCEIPVLVIPPAVIGKGLTSVFHI